jgi:membrane protein DedA with SNARE-associated domain
MTATSQFLISHGGLVLFVMALADQGGLPLPAPPWLLAAGALAASGKLGLFGAFWWAATGSLAADMIWFYLGRRAKGRICRIFRDLESIKRTLPQRLNARLVLRGARTLAAAKFLPLGTVVPLRAGALEVGSLAFFLVDAFCSLFYAAVYLCLGFLFHSQLEALVAFVRKLGVVALVVILAAVGAYIARAVLRRSSKRAPYSANPEPMPSAKTGKEENQHECHAEFAPDGL